MTITETGPGRWDVRSESGQTYQVAFVGERDVSCTCPAYVFAPLKNCKHIIAVCDWLQDGKQRPPAPDNDDLPF